MSGPDARTWLAVDMLRIQGNFEYAIEDATRLLAMHDAETKRRPGRPSRQLEVLKRAAVIVAITAWESFIEDVIRTYGMRQLQLAETPSDVSAWFNSVGQVWLQGNPKPPAVAMWTGVRWKELLKRRLKFDLQALNTPSSSKVKVLSKRYLGTSLCERWKWTRTSAENAARRLDDFIHLRGELVHHSPAFFEHHRDADDSRDSAGRVQRQQVVDGMSLLRNLVRCTCAAVLEE